MVAMGDLDTDGTLDLAVAGRNSDINLGNLAVVLGNSDGSFQAPALLSVGLSSSIAISDLSGDGAPDLAVRHNAVNGRLDLAVANSSTNDVSVLLNTTPFTAFGLIAGAAALIDGFQPPLGRGLASDLQNKLADVRTQLDKDKTSHACDKLDDFSRKVSDEASRSDPSMTSGQAEFCSAWRRGSTSRSAVPKVAL
jgi:FG-GAP-like repeat